MALGQLSIIKNQIERVTSDYVRLLKYSDSLYRCKVLKVAAFGKMVTAIKQLKNPLDYLEEIRKHSSRLPSINPYEPSVLIIGAPSVGKSSFLNKITNANVEISPLPFTTQSLYLGHTWYNHNQIQVIDSPGILDRKIEDKNSIEMQSITALANLDCLILFFLDISETCGICIEE